MRNVLIAVLLAASFSVSSSAKSASFDSIRPLREPVTADDGTTEWTNICTAWASTSKGEPVWITAAHCVLREDGPAESLMIGKHVVTVATWHYDPREGIDVAVLTGGPRAKPFQIAFGDTLNRLDQVWSSGYPHGATDQHTVSGTYGGTEEGLALYSLPVMGGMSGAPVVEMKSGLVVGLVVQRECPVAWCPVARAVTVAHIRTLVH